MLLEITKLAVGLTAEIGVNIIVKEGVKQIVKTEALNKLGKVCVAVGTMGVSSLAAMKVSEHLNGAIDHMSDGIKLAINSVKDKIDEKKEAKAQNA